MSVCMKLHMMRVNVAGLDQRSSWDRNGRGGCGGGGGGGRGQRGKETVNQAGKVQLTGQVGFYGKANGKRGS
ncbi:hypothetical protein Droror1_Dr00025695 [Drosera rotundifolia]